MTTQKGPISGNKAIMIKPFTLCEMNLSLNHSNNFENEQYQHE